MSTNEKIIIYQVFTRLFGNNNTRCKYNGSMEENGCGKMADFTTKALNEIKNLGSINIDAIEQDTIVNHFLFSLPTILSNIGCNIYKNNTPPNPNLILGLNAILP